MTSTHPICRAIEADLVAAASGEAAAPARERVTEHVARCAPCRADFERYRALDALVDRMRHEPDRGSADTGARARLESCLADLRRRLVRYSVFPSPLGHVLIAVSELGVSLVEYLGHATSVKASRLERTGDVEAVEGGAELEPFRRDLLEYLGGGSTRLDWPLDFRLVRGDFDRAVLQAAASIPYGAVTSYARLARTVGKPSAARAVAQALRWNPLPVVVPCHRIVGASGSLVGYAGNKIMLKHYLLSVEGVPVLHVARDYKIGRDAMYVRHRDDPAYCLPSCRSLPQRTLSELTLFGTRERAEVLGLRPCRTCRPDLHPLSH